jgi:hypothetical protein
MPPLTPGQQLMSGHIFKIGVANQANPKMQTNGGQQYRDQPVS